MVSVQIAHAQHDMRIPHTAQDLTTHIEDFLSPYQKGLGSFFDMADPKNLEKSLVDVAVRLGEKRGLSQSELARRVFRESGRSKELKDPYRALRALITPDKRQKDGNPRGLSFSEAFAIATVLEMDLSDVLVLAEKEAKKVGTNVEVMEHQGSLGGFSQDVSKVAGKRKKAV